MQDDIESAIYIEAVLVLISFAVMVAIRWFNWRATGTRAET
jgi:ABC-type sulfate transport system permease component